MEQVNKLCARDEKRRKSDNKLAVETYLRNLKFRAK